MADPGRHTRTYSFSLSLFTSFSLFRVLWHLTRIPQFPVLTRIIPFPVLTRILPSRYSPESHLFGTRPDFYFFDTRPDSTLSRYSPGPGTRSDPTFPVLTRTLFRYSSGSQLSSTRPDPTFPILTRISTFMALAQILPFPGTHPDPSPLLTWIPPF